MVLGIGTALSNLLIETNAPVFSNPKDKCGLDYQDVEFKTDDNVTIRGWWIPVEGSSKCIVHTHFGLLSCRSGYTPDGKGMMAPSSVPMEFLKAIPHYNGKGYNVLMFDLRGHGDSDPHPGQGDRKFATYGKYEEADIRAAVKFCDENKEMQQIFLFGICMGGTATVLAFGNPSEGFVGNPKIKALTFVQPTRYNQFTKNVGIPACVMSMATAVNDQRLGFPIEELSFDDALTKVDKPMLFIQNNTDPFHKREEVQALFDLVKSEKDILWLDGLKADRPAGYYWLCDNPDKISAWFDKYSD